jgi:hypothetical protein
VSESDGDKWEGRFALFMAVGLLCAAPVLLPVYAAVAVWPYLKWFLGQFGRPFGWRWFQETKTDVWETAFLVFPVDDAALRQWLASQRAVIESSVERTEGGVRFRCVRRGWAVVFGNIRERATEAARERGYKTGAFGVCTYVFQQ